MSKFEPEPEDSKNILPRHVYVRDGKLYNGKALLRIRAEEENASALEKAQEKRWRIYCKLSEPRPDYFEWAAAYSRRQEYDDTESIARTAGKLSDRLKAKELLLKYGKTLPKQQVELTNTAQEVTPLNAAQVLDLALKLHGIPQDKFEAFLKSIRA